MVGVSWAGICATAAALQPCGLDMPMPPRVHLVPADGCYFSVKKVFDGGVPGRGVWNVDSCVASRWILCVVVSAIA
jgi:hypothetical protein